MDRVGIVRERGVALAVASTLVFGGMRYAQPTTEQLSRVAALKAIDQKMIVQWDKKTGTPIRMKGKLSATMTGDGAAVARDFFRSNAGLFRRWDSSPVSYPFLQTGGTKHRVSPAESLSSSP